MDQEKNSLKLGIEAFKEGNQDKAIAELKAAADEQPDSFKAVSFLAAAYANKGFYQQAVEAFQRAARIDPKAAGVHYNIAQIYEAMGEPQKAFAALEDALRVDPGHTKAYESLKELRWKLRRRTY